MKKLYYFFILIIFAGVGCGKGSISGVVTLHSGNCMPKIDFDHRPTTCSTKPQSRIIYIHPPVTNADIKGSYLETQVPIITQVTSGIDGKYKVTLPVGIYSVFVDDDGKEYCGFYSHDGPCQINIQNSETTLDITIDHYSI